MNKIPVSEIPKSGTLRMILLRGLSMMEAVEFYTDRKKTEDIDPPESVVHLMALRTDQMVKDAMRELACYEISENLHPSDLYETAVDVTMGVSTWEELLPYFESGDPNDLPC